MFSRKLTLCLAIGVTLAFAGPAQAIVVDHDSPYMEGNGYDFGSASLILGAPAAGGDLAFDLSGGQVEPRLTGTMHIDDAAGTCARMHLEFRDSDEDNLTTARHGGTVCVTDDAHHTYSVDLAPYSDNDIDSVKVQLEKQTATGWYVVDSNVYAMNASDDDVKITEDGVDFGSNLWGVSAPTGSGLLEWDLDGADVTPHLSGTLHLNNSSGVCARMRLRYLSESGTFLKAKHGGEVCADDNGHHGWTVDLDPYGSNKVAKVKVQLQTQGSNGSWNTAGAETVSIAE